MATVQHGLTLEQFLKLPEEEPALEFQDGMVTQKVSPKGPHSRLQYSLAERINRSAEPRKLAMAFPELRITFAGSSVVPDVAVYLWDRVPRDSGSEVASDFLEAPDIAIEVVSPGQSVNSLIRRCLWFVDNGVRIALLVDPEDRSVVRYRAGIQPEVLRGTDSIDLDDILPGFRLAVQELFDSLILR